MDNVSEHLIYLDSNSTTHLEESVIKIIEETCREFWANPSSSSVLGRRAKACIETARERVARCVNTSVENVIFTSGGTEANNMVIESCVRYWRSVSNGKPHIVTSSVEHDATLQYIKYLLQQDLIETTSVPMQRDGSVRSQDFLDGVKDNTCLLTLMMANNETGVVFPVAQLGRSLKELNSQRKVMGLNRILLHTDAAQSIGKTPVDMVSLNVDYLTVVGHKFYGPRIGALCRNHRDTPLSPLLFGGGQEFGLRAGTENTPMIAGLGEACHIVTNNLDKFQKHMKEACEFLFYKLKESFKDDVIFNFNDVEKLPNTLSVSFVNVSGRELLKRCPSVIASTGSACHSSQESISRILLQNLDEDVARGTVRLSVGRTTTVQQINEAVSQLRSAYLTLISH